MAKKLKSIALKHPVTGVFETDLQAYKILLAVADLSLTTTSYLLASVAACGDELKAVKLLGKKEIWKRLSTSVANDLRQQLAKNLVKRRAPDSQLVKALEANPQGQGRKNLLDALCQKASAAMKALESEAKLSSAEKRQLASRVIQVKGEGQANYAAGVLMSWHGLPQDLRSTMLKLVVSRSRSYKAGEIMERPDWYFADSAPMTQKERELLFGHLKHNKYWCLERVGDYGRGETYEKPKLTKKEVLEILPTAIAEIQSRNGTMDGELRAQGILAGQDGRTVRTLLTPEQKETLEKVTRHKKAA